MQNDVKQVDRDAAANLWRTTSNVDFNPNDPIASEYVDAFTQAFAAHRIAAEAKTAELSIATIDRQADEIAALQARVAELEGAGHEIISRAFTTYTARNGRKCGIQDENGEQCMIVPHEPFHVLEELLKEPTQ